MSTFVYYQLYIFLATLYGGIVIGFIYDIYKIYRSYLKLQKIIVAIQDLVFWIAISIVAVFVLIYSNDGVVRGYSLIGFIFGALVYNLLLSRIVVKTIEKFLNIIKKIMYNVYIKIKKILSFFYKILMYPCKRIYMVIKSLILRIKRILKLPNRIFNRIFKEIKKYSKILFSKKQK